MTLTVKDLEGIREEAFAEDIEIEDHMLSWSRARAVAFFEAGGVDDFPVTFTPLPKPKTPKPMSKMDWLKVQATNTPGNTYSMEFPHTFSQISKYGAAWLTRAFQASGAIGKDNAVEEIVELKPALGGGAGEKAFLTVRYTHELPGLHTRLFCKYPHEKDVNHKWFISGVIRHDEPEVRWAQRLAHKSPVPAPKTYFAEYSSASTNYILITERIEFASEELQPLNTAPSAVLQPNQVERVYDKFMDHQIGCSPVEYYMVLANSLGKLIGWYKSEEAIGAELNQNFPFTGAAFGATNMIDPKTGAHPMLPMLAKFADTCKCLFEPDVSTPAYQEQLANEIIDISKSLPSINAYLYSDPDYIGYAHPNANIDNAYWWRDEAGQLQCGLIDFGGYGCSSVTQILQSSLFSADIWVHEKHTDELLQAFIDGCAAMGGPKYELDELRVRWALGQAVNVCTGMPGAPVAVVRSQAACRRRSCAPCPLCLLSNFAPLTAILLVALPFPPYAVSKDQA